jgi:uncharacterized protein YjiS (DUF1127 family)
VRPLGVLLGSLQRITGHFSAAMTARRQRQRLLSLDDRMLSDIGISRTDAYREAHRPFLDVPVLDRPRFGR